MTVQSWKKTNAPLMSGGGRTDDIWFLDRDTGWAVNSNGNILHTANGGETWDLQHQASPTTYLRSVSFSSRTRGWVGTLKSAERLFRTTDGVTWQKVLTLPQQPTAICGLCAVSDQVVYASGTNYPNRPAAVIKTVDGGQSWELLDMSAHASLLVDIFFRTEDIGWVVGGAGGASRDKVKPVILYTADGGATWVNRLAGMEDQFPFGEWGWKIHFIDETVGFVSLENFEAGAVLRTDDGGVTWERLAVNDPQTNANLEGVGFVDASTGWVGGWGDARFSGGYSSQTVDGGRTWTNANEIGRYLNRFRFFRDAPFVGYASGDTVYKYADHGVDALIGVEGPTGIATPGLLLNSENETIESRLKILAEVPADARELHINLWDRFGEQLGSLLHESRPAAGRREFNFDIPSTTGRLTNLSSLVYRMTVDDSAESRVVSVRAPSVARAPATVNAEALPPLPSAEEEREAFFKLTNIEDFSGFRATANAWARAYLANADYGAYDGLYAEFAYTEQAFDERMKAIYEAVLPGMHQPHEYDSEIIEYEDKRYKVGRASKAVVRDRLLQKASFNLLDGVWLQNITMARPADQVQSRLFDIWADEVGNGNNQENHSNVYEDLLRNEGLYLPPVTSREFIEFDFSPAVWRTPVFQMCIGLFPQEFFPELIGMTLLLEWDATPQMHPVAEMLRGRGMNPLFYALHSAIDNIASGHGAIAKQAVKIFLEMRREEGGEAAVQSAWKRIWNGYVAWGTAGFLGIDLMTRRLLIDRKCINIGTPEAPVRYPDYKQFHHDRMVRLILRKAPVASQVHGRATIGGELLNDLFKDPPRLMQKLVDEKYVDPTSPRHSRLMALTGFGGAMYRVFTDEELEVILDWVESLGAAAAPCIEPLPPPSAPGAWAEKMIELIKTYSAMGRRAHDELTLPDATGKPVALVSFFDDPKELMAAMVRGGWIVPGAPDRSMFYTRILNNGGPMSGVFTGDDVKTVYQWILEGAQAPRDVLPTNSVAAVESRSAEASSPPSLLSRRRLVGQGFVH